MEVFNGKRRLGLGVPVIVGATLLTVFSMSRAQSAAPEAMPGPKLQYQSVLGGYKGFNDQRVQPWRETNDQVKNIGGWRAYARETDPVDQAGASPGSSGGNAPERASDKAPDKGSDNTPPLAPAVDLRHKHHGHGSKP